MDIIDLTDVPWDPVSLSSPLNDGSRWVTAVWLLVHWGLRQEGLVGDRMLYLFAAVCRQWRLSVHDPEIRAGLMRILSFDVGTVNLAVWLGSFNPERGRRTPLSFTTGSSSTSRPTCPPRPSRTLCGSLTPSGPS